MNYLNDTNFTVNGLEKLLDNINVTEDIVREMYSRSDLNQETYYECLCMLACRGYEGLCFDIIRDRVNDSNIDDVLRVYNSFYDESLVIELGCYKLIKSKLYEIKNKNLINLCIDRKPLKVKLSEDKVINLTGQSGSGKSYFTKRFDDSYLIVDTDEVFSDNRFDKSSGINRELGEYFRSKYDVLPDLGNDFDLIYEDILDYCSKYDKWIVIDCAQFHCIKDISLIKGIVIVIRTCIDTCYRRCIDRYKEVNSNYTDDELESYCERKKNIYKWYSGSNDFINMILEIGDEFNE